MLKLHTNNNQLKEIDNPTIQHPECPYKNVSPYTLEEIQNFFNLSEVWKNNHYVWR